MEIEGEERVVLVKHGLIDKKGKIIIPVKYIYMSPIDNIGKYFIVVNKETGKSGVLDKSNNIVVPFKYGYILFPEMIKIDDGSIYPDNIYQLAVNNDKLFGVYDLELKKEIIKPKYKYLKVVGYNRFLIGEDFFNCNTLIDENEKIIE